MPLIRKMAEGFMYDGLVLRRMVVGEASMPSARPISNHNRPNAVKKGNMTSYIWWYKLRKYVDVIKDEVAKQVRSIEMHTQKAKTIISVEENVELRVWVSWVCYLLPMCSW